MGTARAAGPAVRGSLGGCPRGSGASVGLGAAERARLRPSADRAKLRDSGSQLREAEVFWAWKALLVSCKGSCVACPHLLRA